VAYEKTLDELLEEDETLKAQAAVERDKAEIAAYKKKYGADYKRVIGKALGGLKSSMHEPPSMMRPKA
jgi:hypothetical protein